MRHFAIILQSMGFNQRNIDFIINLRKKAPQEEIEETTYMCTDG